MSCKNEYGNKKCRVYDKVGLGFAYCDFDPQSSCPDFEEGE